ncbi:phage integrase SAM-like domain-containing protein [Methylophilus sp. 14]|uniref:phage integrase SAM-like domain-containing protein n=1 Tax=Methylophilus sp. 14 TaxID=2781019 RepID=UPI0018908277|nr:phage integrase SAM-like domain-containing protein [Methylophilus sp. 14]MBF4989450.1 phage integrase SAM-like domain-containing protein [Methylophilus sp. 14]
MGTPHKNKKDYSMKSQPIESAVKNEPGSYKFEIDGELLDFSKFKLSALKHEDIGWALAKVTWRKRNEISAATAQTYWYSIDRFFEFLTTQKSTPKVSEINQLLINDFIYWLNSVATLRLSTSDPLAESSKRKIWGHIREYFMSLADEDRTFQNLELPTHVFDSDSGESFKPYSKNELIQISKASFSDTRKIVNGTSKIYRSAYIGELIPHAIRILIKTGINPEVLFDLDITSISVKSSHILNSSRLILPIKRRSGKSQNISLQDEESDGIRVKSNVIRLLEEVENLTEATRKILPSNSPLKNKLWLVRGEGGKIDIFSNFSYYMSLQAFSKRHDIVDDSGDRLVINFRRFRPTFAEEILRINGGDVRDLQKRLGHSHLRTTMGYLDPNLEERKEAFHYSGLALVNWVFKDEKPSSLKLVAEDLDISEENASKLISGEFNVSVGKCKNPFDSPLQGVKKGDFCTQYLACFRCHYSVILKEDGHRLFSFYHWLISKRALVGDQKWQESYEWIIDIIDNEIAPKLGDSECVLSMKREAELNPFPMWSREQ